jgi:hypothetical protein
VLGNWNMAASPRRIETSGNLDWVPIDFGARRDASGSNWCPLFLNGGVVVFCWGQPPEGRLALDLATVAISYAGGEYARVADFAIDRERTCTVTRGGGAYCSSAEFVDRNHDFGLGVEICDGAACVWRGFDVSYWYSKDRNKEFNRPAFIGNRLMVSGSLHTCALTPDSEAYCWGADDRGQLGRPAIDLVSAPPYLEEVGVPDPVVGALTFATLAAGEEHTCGVTWSGETYCWGANGFGQLGDGSQADHDEPVRVSFQE